MRHVIVAANWKMNTDPGRCRATWPATIAAADPRGGGDPRHLPAVRLPRRGRDALADADSRRRTDRVAVGAQNVHHEPAGAYTGEISAPMLAGLATWVIVGHSERRRDAGETDALIGRKLRRGVGPPACGRSCASASSSTSARPAGPRRSSTPQVRGCLAGAELDALGVDDGLPWLTIAYEPVWAIGTGRTARGADAAAMADAIRRDARPRSACPTAATASPSCTAAASPSRSIGEFLAEPAHRRRARRRRLAQAGRDGRHRGPGRR